jgi:NurA-like 5'-3' nuclease
MALEIRNTPSEIRVARVNAILEDGTETNEMIHVYIDQDGVRNTACISFDAVDELIDILLEAKQQSFEAKAKSIFIN